MRQSRKSEARAQSFVRARAIHCRDDAGGVVEKTVSSFEFRAKPPISWRPSGHGSPAFRVGSGDGRVHEIEGGDVTKVGGRVTNRAIANECRKMLVLRPTPRCASRRTRHPANHSRNRAAAVPRGTLYPDESKSVLWRAALLWLHFDRAGELGRTLCLARYVHGLSQLDVLRQNRRFAPVEVPTIFNRDDSVGTGDDL